MNPRPPGSHLAYPHLAGSVIDCPGCAVYAAEQVTKAAAPAPRRPLVMAPRAVRMRVSFGAIADLHRRHYAVDVFRMWHRRESEPIDGKR
jgi:hypothetical protein